MGNFKVNQDVKKSKSWEEFFKLELGAYLDLNLEWNPDRFVLDWTITKTKTDNEAIGFIEAKVRNITIDQYPDYMVGLRKYQVGMNYQTTLGIPFTLAFRMKDGIVLYNPKPGHDKNKIRWSGRSKNKRYEGDVIPCIHILKEYCNVFRNLPYNLPSTLIEHLDNMEWSEKYSNKQTLEARVRTWLKTVPLYQKKFKHFKGF